jgi:hypothetical protein
MLEHYLELHQRFLEELLAYHNIHIDYIKYRQGRDKASVLRKSLKKLRGTAREIEKETINITKLRQDLYKDDYKTQRKNNGHDNKTD